MTHYKVICEHRTDDGLNHATPTHTTTVVVTASDARTARLAAIDTVHAEAHDSGTTVSHVVPVRVVPVLLHDVATVETVHASPEIPLWRWIIAVYTAPIDVENGPPHHTPESFGAAMALLGTNTPTPAAVFHVTDTRRPGRAHAHAAGAFRVRTVPHPGSAADSVHVADCDSLVDAVATARAHTRALRFVRDVASIPSSTR